MAWSSRWSCAAVPVGGVGPAILPILLCAQTARLAAGSEQRGSALLLEGRRCTIDDEGMVWYSDLGGSRFNAHVRRVSTLRVYCNRIVS